MGAVEWQPLVVSTTADGADGNISPGSFSLREAIGVANTMDDDARITFRVTGQIVLGGTELGITNDMSITGPAPNLLTVSGNNASRVFNISGGGTVNISGMTICRGAADAGACVDNGATTLNLDAVTLTENVATGFGGGLSSPGGGGAVTITNSAIVLNTAGNEGGGIENQGVTNSPGSLTLTNCAIAGNTANGAGFRRGDEQRRLRWLGHDDAPRLHASRQHRHERRGLAQRGQQRLGRRELHQHNLRQAGANVVNFSGTVSSLGHNLCTDGSGNLTAGGDLPNTPSARLNTLSNYGGPTPAMQPINQLARDQRRRVDRRRQHGSAWRRASAGRLDGHRRLLARSNGDAHVTLMTYEHETRQAITFNFDRDARVD